MSADAVLRISSVIMLIFGVVISAAGLFDKAAYCVALAIYMRVLANEGGE